MINDFWPHMVLGLRRWHVCCVHDLVFTIQYYICSRVYSTALSTVYEEAFDIKSPQMALCLQMKEI